MKRLLSLIAAAAVMVSSFAAVSAEDDIKVLLDGEPITFGDVAPQIVNDRTLVPFRAIFEALGYEVGWDQATQTVSGTSETNVISMVIGNTSVTSGGETITIDVPPQIIDDRTMVPVRAVAEMSGYDVDWIGETRTVTIVSPEEADEPEATVEPETTEAPAATATPAPTAAPAESGDLPIKFDDTKEILADHTRNFKLLTAEKTADGKYEITFSFETFKEGSGSVEVIYNCLNASGKVIDQFSCNFRSTDYTWTPQTGSATIPGETVTIELAN